MAILAADFVLADGALASLDKFAQSIAKTGTASKKSQSRLKDATTGLKEFVAQVKALQTPFQQMIALSEKGGKEWVKYKAALKEASVGAKQLRADYVHLISAGGSWKTTLDGIYSSQARSIINSKAEVVAAQNLEAIFNKQIATRAQIIGLKDGSTQASLRALAVDEAELVITKAKYAADVNSAKQLAVNIILTSNETLEIKRQALALAGIPPIKMAVAKATEVLTVAETGYTAAAVKSAAQATKQGMALELLSTQSKKRSALLSQLNALENGYAASLAKSLAPLQARVALSQAKNAADINLAKQIVLNTILASNETLEIKRQALALAGIPPIKMAVAKATQAMAVSSAESAVATNAASTAAQRGTGAFTTYGSAVRGAAGALGMLWFAYGQLLPLMAAFAIVRTGQAAVKMGMEFEYSAHMIQTLAKDVENATISVEEINQELLGMEGLRHGPLELAKGMKEFAKAGVAPKEALRDMATMSKFATIAEMDLGEAIKKVIGLTLAFKPTMEAATGELFTFADAANMTAAAAMLTITDVDEMANAFAYAAELGVVSGMKFQEVAAALGIMANAGIRGTKGATSLRMGMIKLQTPTDKALQKIKALNKEFTAFHEDGNAKNIVEVFRDLNKVLDGLPDKERVAIFAELFTARSLRAGAVISQQVKELDSFIKKLEEAAEGIGFIEEKYQDLGTTARAELEFFKVEFEKILLGMTDAGGIAEVLSDMTAALKEMGPGIILVGKAIGAVFHDIINFSLLIRKTVGENISFVIGIFTGENSISNAVDFVKAKFKSLTDYIENWNIRQYFKENFEAFDRYTITFASQFEKSAILIEKYWKNLNLYMKIIWGETINWIIDKLFLIPDNLLKIVNGLSTLTKGVWGFGAYSEGMGIIGEGLEKLISGAKGFIGIDLSKERSELEAINAEYDTRIKKSEEVYQQLRDEHDALWNTKEVVDNLGESFGVLRAQMAGEAAAPTGTPWGYFFGAGGIGEFESVKEQMVASWKNLGDEAQALFDKLFPDEKQRRDYQEMLKLWKQQKDLGLVGEGKPISEAQYQAGFEALKKMLPVAKDGTKALDDYKKEIQSVVDKYLPLQKETNDLEKAEKQLHEARKLGLIKSDEDLKVALDNLTKSSTAYRTEQEKLAEIEKIRQEYRKWEEKYDKEQADLKIKRAKALRDIYEELSETSPDMTTSYIAAQREAIKQEMQILKDELKIDDDLLAALEQKRLDEVFIKAARASNDFFLGIQAGIKELGTSFDKLGELGYQAFYDLKDAFHETFFKALKGDFDEIADRWKSLLNKMLDRFLNFLADLLTNWTMNGLESLLFGSSGGGGIAGAIGSAIGGGLSKALGGTGGGGLLGGVVSSVGSTALGAKIAGMLGLGGTGAGAGGAAGLWGGASLGAGESFVLIGSEPFIKTTAALTEAATATTTAATALSASQIPSMGAMNAAPLYYGPGGAPASGIGMTGIASLAAVAVAGALSLKSFLDKKQAPEYQDYMNAMGYRPADFASLIGKEFQKAVDPIYGKDVMAKFDETSNTLMMYNKEQAKYAEQMHQEYMRQQEKGLYAGEGDTWFGPAEMQFNTWIGDTWTTWSSMALDKIKSVADMLGRDFKDYASEVHGISSEVIDSYLQFKEDVKTPMDKFKDSIKDLGLSASESARLIELAETATYGFGKEAEKALYSLAKSLNTLGLTDEELTGITQHLSLAFTKAGAEFGYTLDSIKDAGPVFDIMGTAAKEMSEDVNKAANDVERAFSDIGSYIVTPQGMEDDLRFAAKGGPIGYAPGGLLRGGSGVRDDLYLGTINGRPQVAMGGEYIVNKKATQKNLSLLEAINAETYATGGMTPVLVYVKGIGGGAAALTDKYTGPPVIPPPSTKRTATGDNLEQLLDMLKEIDIEMGQIGKTDFQNELADFNRQIKEMTAEAKKLGASEADLMKIRVYQDTMVIEMWRKRQEAQAEFMQGITDQIAEFSMTDTEKAIRDTVRQMEESIKAARELGISEFEIAKIRKLQQLQEEDILRKHREAQADFMQGIRDQIAEFGMTDTQKAIQATVRQMEDAIEAAIELGLAESEIAEIRRLQQLQAEEILRKQREAQQDFMQDINDQIASFSLTPMENELLANQRAMEAALKSAQELELGESDLAKIRTLYGLKAQEIMNKGLREGLDALKSFKESMAGVADEAIKSSLAQKKLFDVLSQARAGDFSGVEKIGDILKDISIDKSSYATALDYARDYWKTMNAVSELERLTEGKLEVPVSADTAAVAAAEAAAEAAVAAAESSAAVSAFVVTAAADTAKLVTELRAIKDSIVSGNVQLAKNTSKAARLLERWEAIGMPDTRAA